MTVGGVLDIDCLYFLPASTKGSNGALKFDYLVDDAIKIFPYPGDN